MPPGRWSHFPLPKPRPCGAFGISNLPYPRGNAGFPSCRRSFGLWNLCRRRDVRPALSNQYSGLCARHLAACAAPLPVAEYQEILPLESSYMRKVSSKLSSSPRLQNVKCRSSQPYSTSQCALQKADTPGHPPRQYHGRSGLQSPASKQNTITR